jgi:hypothetical protein
VARDELPDLSGFDVCVSNAGITDTIAPPTDDRRAVDARHRRQPHRRLPGGQARASRDMRERG